MKQSTWTRVTTIANTLADRYALEQWAQRNTVLGLGARQDLYALATSCKPGDRDELNSIVARAQEAAKAHSGANLGTALHRLTERIHSGEEFDIPDQWRPDLEAYSQALKDHSLVINSHWIERVLVIPTLMVAGTVDRIIGTGQSAVVADLKTGENAVRFGIHEIAMQLALYANATHAWRGATDDIKRDRYGRYLLPLPADEPNAYEPMPPVEKDWALVIHLPVGKATCTIHRVDITAGKEAAKHALWVRAWRKRDDVAFPLNGTSNIGGLDDF